MKKFWVLLVIVCLSWTLESSDKKYYVDMLERISRGETSEQDQKIIEALNQASSRRIAELQRELASAQAQLRVGEHWREGFPHLSAAAKNILLSVYNYEKFCCRQELYSTRLERDCLVPSENLKIILRTKPPHFRGKKAVLLPAEAWGEAEIIAPHVRMSARIYLKPATWRHCRIGKTLPPGKYYVLSGGQSGENLRFDLTDDVELVQQVFSHPHLPYWGDRRYLHLPPAR